MTMTLIVACEAVKKMYEDKDRLEAWLKNREDISETIEDLWLRAYLLGFNTGYSEGLRDKN